MPRNLKEIVRSWLRHLAKNSSHMQTSSLPRELLKGLSHEMDLAFDGMNGQHQQTAKLFQQHWRYLKGNNDPNSAF